MAQHEVPEWCAFYPYDFMADEHVDAMTLTERGAYITLLCRQWSNGSIPADLPALARALKVTTAEMEMLWPAIAPCFPSLPGEDGRLANARLEVERKVSLSRIAGSSKGGKTAAERRRKLTTELTTGQPEPSLKSGSTEALCSVLSSKEESKKENQDARWGEFRSIYPAHRFDEEPAFRAWLARESEADAILAGARLWVASDDWTADGGTWVKWASGFISNGIYKTKPQAAQSAAPAPPKPWKADW